MVPTINTLRRENRMTIRELFTKVREERPNSFTDEKLLSFVNEIEYEVAEQLKASFDTEYTLEDLDVELMAASPYDRLYASYLLSQIARANEEMDNYANDAAQHVVDFDAFVDRVIRDSLVEDNPFPTKIKNIM